YIFHLRDFQSLTKFKENFCRKGAKPQKKLIIKLSFQTKLHPLRNLRVHCGKKNKSPESKSEALVNL
ncbi:MAG: hypothetical protein ACI8SN_002691, partial [Algoriphagus sp.]